MYSDVEANTDEDLLVFKAQLFALTGVHPNRQKIVVKGSNVKEWSNVPIKNASKTRIRFDLNKLKVINLMHLFLKIISYLITL